MCAATAALSSPGQLHCPAHNVSLLVNALSGSLSLLCVDSGLWCDVVVPCILCWSNTGVLHTLRDEVGERWGGNSGSGASNGGFELMKTLHGYIKFSKTVHLQMYRPGSIYIFST